MSDAMRAAVERTTRPATLPLLPELRLQLVTRDAPLWQATDADLARMGITAPFWATAWAGGQGLARYLLDHPAAVRGKRVLDLATGSGVVAIAAMKAGAESVRATDIDAYAVEAARLNAALNGVTLELVLGDVIDDSCEAIDVVLAGDVFYDRSLSLRAMRWFRELATGGTSVLVGEAGRYHRPKADLAHRATYDVPATDAIDDDGIRITHVYAVRGYEDPRKTA